MGTVGCVVAGSRSHFVKGNGLERATFDLDCPREQLSVVELSGGVGVSGCGRKAIYVFSMDSGAWVLNGKPAN